MSASDVIYAYAKKAMSEVQTEAFRAGQEAMRNRASTMHIDLMHIHTAIVGMTRAEAAVAQAALEDMLAQIAALPLEVMP
jgi:hypothetical protein